VFAVWAVDFWRGEISVISLAKAAFWLTFIRGKLPISATLLAIVLCPALTVPARAVAETAFAFNRGHARSPNTSLGFPAPEARNLDPVRRVFPRAGPCSRTCGSLIIASVERITLDTLLDIWGPMRGAYLGPYPTKGTALALVEKDGTPISSAEWGAGVFTVGQRTVKLDAANRSRIRTTGKVPLRGAVVQRSVLLVQAGAGAATTVSMFDLGGFGWFATYRYE
jgi:hypothetical protein